MNDANIFSMPNERQFARNSVSALLVIFSFRVQSFEAMRAELAEISSIESNVQHLNLFPLILWIKYRVIFLIHFFSFG
jgi:hypothetical protein